MNVRERTCETLVGDDVSWRDSGRTLLGKGLSIPGYANNVDVAVWLAEVRVTAGGPPPGLKKP